MFFWKFTKAVWKRTLHNVCGVSLKVIKKLQNNFKLQWNYCPETNSTTTAAMNIKQHLFMSSFWSWQVQAFMVPPGPSLPWLGQTGRSSIAPPPHTHTLPSDYLKEGTAALHHPRRGASAGLSSSQWIRISAMSPLDPSEHTSVTNIAQLTSCHRPRPANPHCSPPGCCVWTNHKGQGPVPCDPLFPFEVHTPNLGDNLLWVWNANYKQQGV